MEASKPPRNERGSFKTIVGKEDGTPKDRSSEGEVWDSHRENPEPSFFKIVYHKHDPVAIDI